jgi:hypoxanthine phosphoribosyltransferase
MITIVLSVALGVLSSAIFAGLAILWRRANFRLSFRSVVRMVERLGDSISRDNYQFDYLVTIGRNSGVAGSVLAGQFGLTAAVSISTIKTRLPSGQRTIALDEPSEQVLPSLAHKRTLVFICCNDSGASLEYVVNRLSALPEPPREVRTAALFTSPSPSFRPRYSAVVLDVDSRRSMTRILTGLPWVTQRWRHPFTDERRPNSSRP